VAKSFSNEQLASAIGFMPDMTAWRWADFTVGKEGDYEPIGFLE
jgi:hypothetical protein